MPIDQGTSGAGARIPDLSRVAFFDGQRLEAADLNGAADVQRQFRWLHNRSLHNWGIGLGYAVQGAKGDRQVTISPGYAVDCQGRELILTRTLTKPVPARADDGHGKAAVFYLVAAYPDDTRLTALERRDGDCGAGGAVRYREEASIYWKPQDEAVASGMEIVLAQAKVQNCRLAAALSTDQRRYARPPQQPYIAAGESTLGATGWELWQSTATPTTPSVTLGVLAKVDTSDARFGTAPEYQARVNGPRLIAGPDGREVLLEGMAVVLEPKRDGFSLGVILPPDQTGINPSVPLNPPSLLGDAAQLLKTLNDNWTVVWLGVEG